MKKLSFLFAVILFAAFSISSANAQTFQDKTVLEDRCWMYECDGVTDIICGTLEFHFLRHLDKDGYIDWAKTQIKSKDLESRSGEKFKLSYKSNVDYEGCVMTVFYHFTLNGDMGTKVIYQMKMIRDYCTWPPVVTIIDEKSKCL